MKPKHLHHRNPLAFFSAIRSVWRNRSNFDGAATRLEFWYFQLFCFLISNFFILPLDAIIFSYFKHSPISTIWVFVLLRFNFPLVIRRLYDSGTPARYALTMLFIFVGFPLIIHIENPWLFFPLLILILLGSGYFIRLMMLKSWYRDQPRGMQKY